MIVEFEFEPFESVKLKTDPALERRVVTAHMMRGNNKQYELSVGSFASWHLAPEIERWNDNTKGIGFGSKK